MKWTKAQCLAILGLPPTAEIEQVRKAYRQLVKRWHPDVNPDPQAIDQFRKIQKAYDQITSNDFRREAIIITPTAEQREQEELEKKERRRKMREAYLKKKAEKERQEAERRNREFKYYAMFTLAFILLNLGSYKGRMLYIRWNVLQKPDTTFCEITYLSYRQCHYRYQVNGQYYSGERRTRKVGANMVGGNGLPLREGQQFRLVYRLDEPENHFIDYMGYSRETFEQYAQQSQAMAKYYFSATDSTLQLQADCFVWRLYRDQGLEGWADLYFAQTSWLDNIKNNSSTFASWLESTAGQQALKECTLP